MGFSIFFTSSVEEYTGFAMGNIQSVAPSEPLSLEMAENGTSVLIYSH